MKKIVFYIVERPVYSSDSSGEFKDDQIFENSGLAPIEVSNKVKLNCIAPSCYTLLL